jgi:hypothetical protein
MTHRSGCRRSRLIVSLCNVLAAVCALVPINFASPASEPEYDLVILNGRVVDPESNLDAIRNIGIKNGAIHAISEKSLRPHDYSCHRSRLKQRPNAKVQTVVYFAEDGEVRRNLLGRQGWLQLIRFGSVDYDSELYLGLYDE